MTNSYFARHSVVWLIQRLCSMQNIIKFRQMSEVLPLQQKDGQKKKTETKTNKRQQVRLKADTWHQQR